MISREYSEFVLSCDNCGEEIAGFNTLSEALDYMADHQWESQRDDGHWDDICESCMKRINERPLSQKT